MNTITSKPKVHMNNAGAKDFFFSNLVPPIILIFITSAIITNYRYYCTSKFLFQTLIGKNCYKIENKLNKNYEIKIICRNLTFISIFTQLIHY